MLPDGVVPHIWLRLFSRRSHISKTISRHTYYYLVESARVGGKPRIVSQRYLAKASDIEAAIDGATVMPDRTRHLAFGDVATVWEMLWRLRVAEMIDRWLQLLAGALRSRRLRPETLRQTESQVL